MGKTYKFLDRDDDYDEYSRERLVKSKRQKVKQFVENRVDHKHEYLENSVKPPRSEE